MLYGFGCCLAVLAMATGRAFAAVAGGEAGLVIESGWSTADSESVAVRQAADRVRAVVPRPGFLLVLTTSGYDMKKTASMLSARFPSAKLFVMDSYQAVFSDQGYHKGNKGALALLGFQGGGNSYGVAAGDLSPCAAGGTECYSEKRMEVFVREAAISTIRRAIKDAGRRDSEQPALVILGAHFGTADYLADAVTEFFGRGVRVVGGVSSAGNGAGGRVSANGVTLSSGMAVALVYSSATVGTFFHAGFMAQNRRGVITSARGGRIYEIDGKPAFDVYNKWLGGSLGSRPSGAASSIWGPAHLRPLARVINMPGSSPRYIISVSLEAFPDGSISQASLVREGESIALMRGSADILSARGGYVARKALVDGRIKRKDLAGGFHIYCQGAAFVGLAWSKGEAGLVEMTEGIKTETGGRPFIGAFSLGEEGSVKGQGAFHGNYMSSMAVFRQ